MRMAREREALPDLDTLSLQPVHPAAIFLSTSAARIWRFPSPSKEMTQHQNLNMEMDNMNGLTSLYLRRLSGTRRRERRYRRSGVICIQSARSPSRRTANWLRRARAIGQSGSGTQGEVTEPLDISCRPAPAVAKSRLARPRATGAPRPIV